MTDQEPDLTDVPDEDPAVPADGLHDAEDVPSVPPADEASADTTEFIDDTAAAATDDDPPTEPGGAPADDDPVATAQRERDEYLDALRRKQAEFENFRKRMMRDGASQRISGHAEVAERMLDVLDDFDRTLEAADTDARSQGRTDVDDSVLKGVQLVHDKLVRVLEDFGLTRIDDAGTFDPNRHEAVQQVEADEDLDEPMVDRVLRPGYELGGRVLRPAMVVVRQ